MIHGLIAVDKVDLSKELKTKMKAVGAAWKIANSAVPPVRVYPKKDIKYVEKLAGGVWKKDLML